MFSFRPVAVINTGMETRSIPYAPRTSGSKGAGSHDGVEGSPSKSLPDTWRSQMNDELLKAFIG